MTRVRPRLTAKQEAFCVFYFQDKNATTAAVKAGYSPLYAGENADKILKVTNVQQRIAELEAKVANKAICSVRERQEYLTKYIRAHLADFVDGDGEPVLSRDIPNSEAVAEYTIKHGKFGDSKSIKLRDPIAAIRELNDMTPGAHVPTQHQVDTTIKQIALVEVVINDRSDSR